jgi:hypothetical protein
LTMVTRTDAFFYLHEIKCPSARKLKSSPVRVMTGTTLSINIRLPPEEPAMHVNLIVLAAILAIASAVFCLFSVTLPLLLPVLAITLAVHSIVDAQHETADQRCE